MNTTMVARWNRIVKPHDLVIHVGDFIFTKGPSEDVAKAIKSLNGRKILIRGNHDRKSFAWYLTNGIDFICDKAAWYYNHHNILFIHNPSDITVSDFKKYKYIIHGHQHNSKPFLQKKGKCKLINMSVEHIKYTPVNLITLLNRLKQGFYEEK